MLLCSYLLAICLTAEILSEGLKHNLKPPEFLPFHSRISVSTLPVSFINSFKLSKAGNFGTSSFS